MIRNIEALLSKFNKNLDEDLVKCGVDKEPEQKRYATVPGTLIGQKQVIGESFVDESECLDECLDKNLDQKSFGIKEEMETVDFFDEMRGRFSKLETGNIAGYRVIYPDLRESKFLFQTVEHAQKFINTLKESAK